MKKHYPFLFILMSCYMYAFPQNVLSDTEKLCGEWKIVASYDTESIGNKFIINKNSFQQIGKPEYTINCPCKIMDNVIYVTCNVYEKWAYLITENKNDTLKLDKLSAKTKRHAMKNKFHKYRGEIILIKQKPVEGSKNDIINPEKDNIISNQNNPDSTKTTIINNYYFINSPYARKQLILSDKKINCGKLC